MKQEQTNLLLVMLLCILCNANIFATKEAKPLQSRIDPPFWWVGMQNPTLEILIYEPNKNIGDYEISINSPGVTFVQSHIVENKRYLFIEVKIEANAPIGTFPIELSKGDDKVVYNYELKKRINPSTKEGLSSKDVIYLLFPDRFSNGNKDNDNIEGFLDKADRSTNGGRHGGDIQGIVNHLDYVKNLGVSTIWFNPFLENDQPEYSYHGYAITDHYNVDPRFGSNQDYLSLVENCHNKNMKVIMDVVYNHFGSQHYLYRDLPTIDFINNKNVFQRTSYREPPVMDPYAAKSDKKNTSDGWFDKHMPDLNQNNPRVARYLIQNSIWWIEFAGIDGFRIDTYYYTDIHFSAALGKAINTEYPNFGLFGETWVKSVPLQAYFAKNNGFKDVVNTHLPSITDYMLFENIKKAYKEEMNWMGGIMEVYYTLAQDFLYENPMRNIIFLDNHDVHRIAKDMDGNVDKIKSTLAFLLTTRGIPCIMYGTEIGIKNETYDHGQIRADFPGGWEGDAENKFEQNGRNDYENEIFNFMTTLLHYRNETPAIHSGKLTQFIPENGVYVYFRYDNEKTVMIAMNTHGKAATLDTTRFQECIKNKTTGKNIITNQRIDISSIVLKPYETFVVELQE